MELRKMLKPQRLGNLSLPDMELTEDKKTCRKFGPCGVGKKAIYLNSFYIERRYYVPMKSVKRIFKRIAMSKGGFTGKGAFGTLPYLVVEYDDGKEKQCNFKHEEDVDRLLAYVEVNFPQIPLHSEVAEQKLAEKAKRMEEKQRIGNISETAKKNIRCLDNAIKYLHKDTDLYLNLSQSAKKKRVYDRSNPAYKWVALAITLMGLGALGMVYIHWLHTQDLEFISFCSVLQQSFCFPVLVYCRRHIITEAILKSSY